MHYIYKRHSRVLIFCWYDATNVTLHAWGSWHEADFEICPEMHVLASNMNRQPPGDCSPFLPLHVFLDISADFTCFDSARQGVDKIILCRVNIDVVAVSNFRNLGITGSKRWNFRLETTCQHTCSGLSSASGVQKYRNIGLSDLKI